MNAILIDVSKCTGCEECVMACKEENELGPDRPFTRLSRDGLSSTRFSSIVRIGGERFARKMCLHCLEPACQDACLVGALKKTELGPVVYDEDKCIGCRYCMLACPMEIPRYDWDKKIPYVKKCEMCVDRLELGQTPACVEACPEEALFFGEREALIRQARATIQAEPQKYLQHVYGESELGGTCVLYISDVALDRLGWPEKVGEHPIHDYTWPVMKKTPWVAFGMAGMLSATMFVINRRMKFQEAALREAEAGPPPEDADDRKD
jgi:formate dehydrogenase iron-sulfur subunit